jgi:hypothetical protein
MAFAAIRCSLFPHERDLQRVEKCVVDSMLWGADSRWPMAHFRFCSSRFASIIRVQVSLVRVCMLISLSFLRSRTIQILRWTEAPTYGPPQTSRLPLVRLWVDHFLDNHLADRQIFFRTRAEKRQSW